tara:strand:+ start:14 stop:436 length:423 start_codon:yes stop_codon:yes gene_type:complete
MQSRYGGSSMKRNSPKRKMKPAPKGTHRMPDGKLMTGSTHNKDSKPISEAKAKAMAMKKNSPKSKDRNFIQKMDMKEGALKKMLKVKDGDKKLGLMELIRALKADNGSMFKFRDVELKMTPLMRKRMNTAITLMKLSKKK